MIIAVLFATFIVLAKADERPSDYQIIYWTDEWMEGTGMVVEGSCDIPKLTVYNMNDKISDIVLGKRCGSGVYSNLVYEYENYGGDKEWMDQLNCDWTNNARQCHLGGGSPKSGWNDRISSIKQQCYDLLGNPVNFCKIFFIKR